MLTKGEETPVSSPVISPLSRLCIWGLVIRADRGKDSHSTRLEVEDFQSILEIYAGVLMRIFSMK